MFERLTTSIKRAFAKSSTTPTSGPASRMVPMWQAASPLTPSQDYRGLLDTGYRRNVIVYCCIDAIASSVAEPRLVVRNADDEEIDAKEMLPRLMRRPNPEQPKFTFLEGMLINLQATGNAYIQKLRNKPGMPVQLWNLRPDRIKIKVGSDGEIERYDYSVGAGRPLPLAPEDIIHLKLHDPLDDHYGLSPLAVAARILNLDDQGLDYLRAFFVNGAAPAGILKFKEPVEPEERERIKKLWKEMYGTQRGWHEIAVLDALTEWQEIGSRPGKLGMNNIWDTTETRLCAAFKTPPIIVQLSTGLAHATYSNYKEAIRAWWERTLVPMYGRIGEMLTVGLAGDFAGDLRIEFDVSKVGALQEAQSERRTFALSAWQGNLATKNEARELAGLPKVPDGDKFFSESQPQPPAAPPGAPIGEKKPDGKPARGDEDQPEGKELEKPAETEGRKPAEVHGDEPGHPFRGNQWTSGEGGGSDEPAEAAPIANALRSEPRTSPAHGSAHAPDVNRDSNGDGVTDAARVGLPAKDAPPPPQPPEIPRMPNLTADEREVEEAFASAFERDPKAMIGAYQKMLAAQDAPEKKITFGTDDVKALTAAWSDPDNRARYNVSLHQTANAIAKRAFLEHLDTLKAGDRVLVTNGGCGAGKGYALKNIAETKSLSQQVGAIWDSAGDQNATENTWIMAEAQRRGLRPVFAYVHADPFDSFGSETKGVLKRANNPDSGRMVDVDVFADSYVVGAKNFAAFQEKHAKDADFIFIENKTTPKLLKELPREALDVDRNKLAAYARKTVAERASTLRPSVIRGAMIGSRIWSKSNERRTGKHAAAQPASELEGAGAVRLGGDGGSDGGPQGAGGGAGAQGPAAEPGRQPQVVVPPITINLTQPQPERPRGSRAALRALARRLEKRFNPERREES